MLKRLKTVSMMLFLLGTSTGAAFAVSAPGADDVKIVQQSGTATGTVEDAMGPVIGASVVVKGTTKWLKFVDVSAPITVAVLHTV